MKFFLFSLGLIFLFSSQTFSSQRFSAEALLVLTGDRISGESFKANPKIIFDHISKEAYLEKSGGFNDFSIKGTPLPKINVQEGALYQLYSLNYMPSTKVYTYQDLLEILNSSKILSTEKTRFGGDPRGWWVTDFTLTLENTHPIKAIVLGFRQIFPQGHFRPSFFV